MRPKPATPLSRVKHSTNEPPRSILTHEPEVIKLFSCSTHLSTKFILLIIHSAYSAHIMLKLLAFEHLSMINTTSERITARNFFICR